MFSKCLEGGLAALKAQSIIVPMWFHNRKHALNALVHNIPGFITCLVCKEAGSPSHNSHCRWLPTRGFEGSCAARSLCLCQLFTWRAWVSTQRQPGRCCSSASATPRTRRAPQRDSARRKRTSSKCLSVTHEIPESNVTFWL